VQIDPGVRAASDLSCSSCRCVAAGMVRGRICLR
jgi:hypothetical protein